MTAGRRFRRRENWFVGLLFAFAMFYRLMFTSAFPPPYANCDEYSNCWVGLSLLHGEAPKGWSLLEVPSDTILGSYPLGGSQFPIVQPGFDHPPLFSLLAGATAFLSGAPTINATLTGTGVATTLWDVPIGRVRLLPGVLYGISWWLLLSLARGAVGRVAALVAVAVFSVVGTMAVHQRLVVSDNLLVPLALWVLRDLDLWRRGRITDRRAACVVVAGIALAGLTKIIGLSLAAGVIAWVASLYQGPRAWRACRWAAVGVAVFAVVQVAYAAVYGMGIFLRVSDAQAARFYDLNGLLDAIREQRLMDTPAFDEWIMGGWIVAFAGMASVPRGGARALLAALLGISVAFGFFAPVAFYGWHLLLFFPFLCLAWGWAIRGALRCPRGLSAVVTVVLLCIAAAGPWLDFVPATRGVGRLLYLLLAVSLLLPWGFKWDGARTRVLRAAILGLLAMGLIGEAQNHLALILAEQAQAASAE